MKPDETTIFGDRGIKVDIGVFRYIQFHAVNCKIAKINLHFKTVSPQACLRYQIFLGTDETHCPGCGNGSFGFEISFPNIVLN